MSENYYVYAINMDDCPKDSTVLTRMQCSGCPYYCGFIVENALPCIKCGYYSQSEKDNNAV